MKDGRVRSAWQFHLSTAIVLLFAAALMLIPISSMIHEACSENVSNSPDTWNVFDVANAIGVAVSALVLLAVACEHLHFHRSSRHES